MIKVFEKDVKTLDRRSSKGVQLKWENDKKWYKADSMGYEGLSEYIISHLLKQSNLNDHEYALYSPIEIKYKKQIFTGCVSDHFLPDSWQMITLERLFQNAFGVGLNKSIYSLTGEKERLEFLVSQTERITGLANFGSYMSKLLTVDTFFLNEDRHTHNIAVLIDTKGNYHYCPLFDHGASLLSDTTLDYPMSELVYDLIHDAKPKTFTQDFDIQLDTSEALFGKHLIFNFTKNDVYQLLMNDTIYDQSIKNRVLDIIYYQMDKYNYLFHS